MPPGCSQIQIQLQLPVADLAHYHNTIDGDGDVIYIFTATLRVGLNRCRTMLDGHVPDKPAAMSADQHRVITIFVRGVATSAAARGNVTRSLM